MHAEREKNRRKWSTRLANESAEYPPRYVRRQNSLETNFLTTLHCPPVVPVRLVVRNFGELRRTCLLDARNTDSLRVSCPQLAGVELGKTGEYNGVIHLITLEDATRVNGTIASEVAHPRNFPALLYGKSTDVSYNRSRNVRGELLMHRLRTSTAAAHVAHHWGPQGLHTTPHVRCCRNLGIGSGVALWSGKLLLVPRCTTEICHATGTFKCWKSWVGEVTGGATETGPAAIAQCTGEDGRGSRELPKCG